MDAMKLITGYKSILRTIYSPKEFYQRALDCLERVADERRETRRSSALEDVLSFGRVVLALGIRDGARGEFWRYLRRALTEHREKFAYAVSLAAMGYHFRKITDDYCG
jgi:hypothetical protein